MPEGSLKKDATSLTSLPQSLALIPATTSTETRDVTPKMSMSLPKILARNTATIVADHRDITFTPRHRLCLCLQVLQLYPGVGSTSQSGRSFEKMKVGHIDPLIYRYHF
jgi:hypothetical protein